MYHSIVASALSIKPTKWEKAQNADKLEAFIREAARERPDVIVAPEGFLEGYLVMDVVRDPSKAEAMHALAEPLYGTYIQRFQSLARGLKRSRSSSGLPTSGSRLRKVQPTQPTARSELSK